MGIRGATSEPTSLVMKGGRVEKPRIYAEVSPPPEAEESTGRVVLRGMVFPLETVRMDARQARAIAAELNDRLEAGDLNELIIKGQVERVRDHIFRRVVRYCGGKAAGRQMSGMGPLSTMAALTAGVGDLAVTASEAALGKGDQSLSKELFEAACRGAVVVILETIILLQYWGIDARTVVKTFLDTMEGREEDEEPAEVTYLHLVKDEEKN